MRLKLRVEVLKNVIKNHSSEEKLIDKIKKLEIEELDVIIEKELKNKKSLKM